MTLLEKAARVYCEMFELQEQLSHVFFLFFLVTDGATFAPSFALFFFFESLSLQTTKECHHHREM